MLPLLEVRGLTVDLPTAAGWIRPVRDVAFRIEEGESLGVAGESGSGKTMLALALMGLLPKGARVSGEAWLRRRSSAVNTDEDDRLNLPAAPPKKMRACRGREVAMIFQEPLSALNPVMRAGSQIAEAIRSYDPRLSSGEVQMRTIEAMRRAAIPEPERRARQFPHQLSGGLRQRVMIAMALAAGPRILIADEPTTALDATVQKQILELLAGLREQLRLAIIFITHDLGVVSEIADRLCVMYAGRIVEEGPSAEVLSRPRHPYTDGLLHAAPRLHRAASEPIPGQVPQLDALPPGCSFGPRCAWHREECDAKMPELRPAGPEHRARCVLV
jgi:oligopeptide/dipeptide ABC transporter ATP-binding protein